MQYVRCDACGAKAILAASRCPKCAVALHLRDHRGVLVDLTRCRSCETYFPASKEACKWCGPTRPSHSRRVAGIVGSVAAVVGLAVLWQAMGRPTPWGRGGAADAGVGFEGDRLPEGVIPVPEEASPIALGDTAPVPPSASSEAVRDSGGSIARAADAAVAPAPTGEPPLPVPIAAVSGPWASMRASTWVNVRAGAARDAQVIAVVTKDSVVLLGAEVAGWRPLRVGAIVGWVDRRLFEPAPGR